MVLEVILVVLGVVLVVLGVVLRQCSEQMFGTDSVRNNVPSQLSHQIQPNPPKSGPGAAPDHPGDAPDGPGPVPEVLDLSWLSRHGTKTHRSYHLGADFALDWGWIWMVLEAPKMNLLWFWDPPNPQTAL